jgi:hypothetical protein
LYIPFHTPKFAEKFKKRLQDVLTSDRKVGTGNQGTLTKRETDMNKKTYESPHLDIIVVQSEKPLLGISDPDKNTANADKKDDEETEQWAKPLPSFGDAGITGWED